jgi:sugar lactone lactonase YvrE
MIPTPPTPFPRRGDSLSQVTLAMARDRSHGARIEPPVSPSSRRHPGPRALVALAFGLLILTAAPPAFAQDGREALDIRLFARVGDPGQPEAIAVGEDRTVYVGTNQQERGDTDAPSKVFAYSPRGELLRDYTIRGQDLEQEHGIQGLAIDADGLLYALDRSADPRVIRLDPRTGEQRDYAHFRDVPSCGAAGRSHDCSDTVGDMESAPNFPAFGPDGSLYVTDIEQALIWRVPAGGGRPEVFFTDRRLENLFGPNGIQFMAGGHTLMFAVTAQSPAAGNPTQGRLFTLPVRPDGSPGELGSFYRSRPFDGPDGFAIARSGNVYLALAGASQLVLISPTGEELRRVPDPIENRQMDPPFDGPASVAFLGQSVLVTNQSYPAGNPDHWAVFDVFAGESGLPLFRPEIGEPRQPGPSPPGGQPRPGPDGGGAGGNPTGGDESGRDPGEEREGARVVGVGASEEAEDGPRGGLPFTGAVLAPLVLAAAVLLVAGAALRGRAGR